MDCNEQEKENSILEIETKYGLSKYGSFDYRKYYCEVLKLNELHEINENLKRMSKTKSEGDKRRGFFCRFNNLDEALDYIDSQRNSLPELTDKLIIDISSSKPILRFDCKN